MTEIPQFLQNTQIEKIMQSELNFKKQILRELRKLLENFRTINVEESIKSRYISLMMLSIFKAFHLKAGINKDLIQSLKALIFALKSIGTDESFHVLFKAFLHARVEVSVNSATPGEINIKLLDNIRSPIRFKIAGKIKGVTTKISVKHKGLYRELESNYIPKDFKDSVYGFIKSLIPVGRTIKIFDTYNKEVKS
ncbi:hypothetical protein CR532_04795 (plasmid) [Candidatus Borreliella tachyglossi]|uniref:Uncharacterized protein n=1 Tax=Candidatus Borreliella tachyglossi TaxID=1964448 RepID=A0A2S1LYE3_9SPIR|nr:DUF735 family protein [Candidatus Borreliella tachyglossi]AWG43318.1 hypothetical protein CR532_04795 [Candidatus Borreliella tachyglossi]